MLQLISKKNKLFFRDNEGKESFLLDNRPGVQDAPDWIKDTLGFEMGLKDKSIVDPTPPEQQRQEVAGKKR
jgi:hypothetical protein